MGIFDNLMSINKDPVREFYKVCSAGDKLCKKGEYEEALKAYNYAQALTLELNNNKCTSHYFYVAGLALYKLKKYRDAISYLNASVEYGEMSEKEDKYMTLIEVYTSCEEFEPCIKIYDILLSSCKSGSKKYKEYQNLKTELIKKKADIENINKINEAESIYKGAIKFYKDKRYKKAISDLKRVITLNPNNKEYKNKLDEINEEYKKVQTQANKFYKKAKQHYENEDFDKAIQEIAKATDIINDSKYINFKNDIEAANFYKKAEEILINKNFDEAIPLINNAIKLSPSNSTYKEFKQKITLEQKEIEKHKEAQKYYEAGVKAFQNADFSEAIKNSEQAIVLQANNEEYKILLEKAKLGKIDIMNCTKKALLTLDFIEEQTAENIIKERNDGKIWYDYQIFAEHFNIMPHKLMDIEARIIFPLKQANKYGRKLDC